METATTATQQSNPYSGLIIIAVFAIVMYLLVIRPQNKKDKEARAMRDSIKIGDEIITIGGFYGKVVKVKEDRITIACGSDKVKLDIAKSAISSVLNADGAPKAAAKAEDKKEEKVTSKKIRKLGKKEEAPAEEIAAEEAPVEAPAEENTEA